MRFLNHLNREFEAVKITEYLENNYTIEVAKSNKYSIGYIFGVLEGLVKNLFIIRKKNVRLMNTLFQKHL